MQGCSLNGIAFIQIAPPFHIMSEFTLYTSFIPQYIYIYMPICINMPDAQNVEIAQIEAAYTK